MRHPAASLAASLALVPALALGAPAQLYPNVVDVRVQATGGNRFDFDVTLSSPYDTPQRYADAFRVTGADGRTFGVRTLYHDHANEQPFTRGLAGVHIPVGVRSVIVEGRDMRYGYGGRTVEVALPGR